MEEEEEGQEKDCPPSSWPHAIADKLLHNKGAFFLESHPSIPLLTPTPPPLRDPTVEGEWPA